MTATEILSELERRGVELQVVGDKLRFRPVDAVTPEMLETLRAQKAELLRLLAKAHGDTSGTGKGKCPGPEKCGGCYAIPGSRYIHPPRISHEIKEWFERWKPQGKVQ